MPFFFVLLGFQKISSEQIICIFELKLHDRKMGAIEEISPSKRV